MNATPCTGRDEWTSENVEDRLEAAYLCIGCPVAQQCLDGAVARQEKFSVYGGVDFGCNDGKGVFRCSATWDCGGTVTGFGQREIRLDKTRRDTVMVPACDRHRIVHLRAEPGAVA